MTVHPLLFALYPILALFAHNAGSASFDDLLVPSAVSLAGTLGVNLRRDGAISIAA